MISLVLGWKKKKKGIRVNTFTYVLKYSVFRIQEFQRKFNIYKRNRELSLLWWVKYIHFFIPRNVHSFFGMRLWDFLMQIYAETRVNMYWISVNRQLASKTGWSVTVWLALKLVVKSGWILISIAHFFHFRNHSPKLGQFNSFEVFFLFNLATGSVEDDTFTLQ